VTKDIFARVDEQAKVLRNAEALPYHDLLDAEKVASALAEEKLAFRHRGVASTAGRRRFRYASTTQG
jgi:hypothetical protein